MKPLVIYHDNCADGFGAAFAAWLKLGGEAEYLPMQYNPGMDCLQDFPPDGRDVYILDFSLPRHQMDELFIRADRVVWLDHHKTAFEMWIGGKFDGSEGDHHQEDQVRYITLSQNKSGAMLAWEYFHPGEEVPMLIRHIDDYDRWQFKITGTKAFNKALWSYAPWSFILWRDLFSAPVFSKETWRVPEEFYIEGEAILRAHEQNVQSVVKGAARECIISGNAGFLGEHEVCKSMRGLAANCPPHLTSDVGHELANKSGTFGLCWYLDSGNVVRCSLRSNGGYDVSAIARGFGGGGHRNAAGFSSDIQTLMGWLK